MGTPCLGGPAREMKGVVTGRRVTAVAWLFWYLLSGISRGRGWRLCHAGNRDTSPVAVEPTGRAERGPAAGALPLAWCWNYSPFVLYLRITVSAYPTAEGGETLGKAQLRNNLAAARTVAPEPIPEAGSAGWTVPVYCNCRRVPVCANKNASGAHGEADAC